MIQGNFSRLALAVLIGLICSTHDTFAAPRARVQTAKLAVERALKGGEVHRYPLKLNADDVVKTVVEQKGIDVVLRLIGPDGKVAKEANPSDGTLGKETLSVVASASGDYFIEVASLDKAAPSGKYELTADPPRAATDRDRVEIETETINAEIEKLYLAGKHDEAFPQAVQAAEKAERLLGPDHPIVAKSLSNLGLLHEENGEYAKAEPLLLRALAIDEKAAGPDDSTVAVDLNNLAVLHDDKGEYLKSEPLYLRALAVFDKSLGPDHRNSADCAVNLANLYRRTGKYAKAEPLYLRALDSYRKTLGPDHTDFAFALNSLGALHTLTGDFGKSETLLRQALAIREKALGPDHADVAPVLNNLVVLYRDMGDSAKAEQLQLRALAIREKTLGPEHPDVALALNNLAVVVMERGDYTKAEQLFLRALAIREKVLGPNHPMVAFTLNGLANLHQDKGDYAKAEPLLLRALAIREKTLGPDHPSVAVSLNNLAELYRNLGRLDEAEPFYLRAIAVREKVFGPNHPDIAFGLNTMAKYYQDRGDFEKAESMFRRALAIREKALGPDHRLVGYSVENLASLYMARGDWAHAEPLFRRVVPIAEKFGGPEHPDVASYLNGVAWACWSKGDIRQAVACQSRANEIMEHNQARNLVSGSERQKLLYLAKQASVADRTVSLNVLGAPDDPAAARAGLTVVLRRKGRALDAMAQGIETLRRRAAPEDQELMQELERTNTRLSNLILKGAGDKGIEAYLAAVKELEQQVERLQNQIAARNLEYRAQSQAVTLEAVQRAIPPGAVLIEYFSYRPFDPRTVTYGPRRYAVYVLADGKPTNASKETGAGASSDVSVRVADLGEVDAIDAATATLRQAFGDKKTDPNREVKSAAKVLDKLVMKPVRALIGDAVHLLVSPDGALNLVPFAALVDENGKYLVERYTLTYLTSGRDLLRLGVNIESREPPLVMADPDYSLGDGPQLFGQPVSPLRRLAGTRTEGSRLKTILPDARLRMEAEASETTLKSVTKPFILHVATHGYFRKDAENGSRDEASRNLTRVDAGNTSVGSLPESNPLLRSGLFFAGANKGGDGNDDGFLTALEAAQLDLWGTKLVVLSACDTGLGDVTTGDGIYGLRRALALAGSESQMMSLWPVSDTGTRELMVGYYAHLKAGEGRSEALRNIQLDLLRNPRRRHPFFWAGFIQSGEWKPVWPPGTGHSSPGVAGRGHADSTGNNTDKNQ